MNKAIVLIGGQAAGKTVLARSICYDSIELSSDDIIGSPAPKFSSYSTIIIDGVSIDKHMVYLIEVLLERFPNKKIIVTTNFIDKDVNRKNLLIFKIDHYV